MWVALYKAITAKLEEIGNDTGGSVFAYIDLDRKQIQNRDFPQHLLPIALISFLNTPWEDTNQGHQEGELTFAIDAYFDGFGDSFQGAHDQDQALEHLDIKDQLFYAFQHFSVENVSLTPFTRTGDQQIATSRPNTFGYRMLFKGMVAQCLPDQHNQRPLEENEISHIQMIQHGFPG